PSLPCVVPSPTRRSSDLTVVQCCVERINGLLAEHRSGNGNRRAELSGCLANVSSFELWVARKYAFDQLNLRGRGDVGAYLEFMRDRKSTRLNSSHVKISY